MTWILGPTGVLKMNVRYFGTNNYVLSAVGIPTLEF